MSWVASADPRVPDLLGTRLREAGFASADIEAFDFTVALLSKQQAAA